MLNLESVRVGSTTETVPAQTLRLIGRQQAVRSLFAEIEQRLIAFEYRADLSQERRTLAATLKVLLIQLLKQYEDGQEQALTLAHLDYRVIRFLGDQDLSQQVEALIMQYLPPDMTLEQWRSSYHHRFASQIIATLRGTAPAHELLDHFENRLTDNALQTEEEREDFSMILCVLLIEFDQQSEELLDLMTLTLPSGENPTHFVNQFFEARTDLANLDRLEQLRARVEVAAQKAISSASKASDRLGLEVADGEAGPSDVTQKLIEDAKRREAAILNVARGMLEW